MYFIYIYRDKKLKPVKIILNWGQGMSKEDDEDEANQGTP
jgi:hypothetical protein